MIASFEEGQKDDDQTAAALANCTVNTRYDDLPTEVIRLVPVYHV